MVHWTLAIIWPLKNMANMQTKVVKLALTPYNFNHQVTRVRSSCKVTLLTLSSPWVPVATSSLAFCSRGNCTEKYTNKGNCTSNSTTTKTTSHSGLSANRKSLLLATCQLISCCKALGYHSMGKTTEESMHTVMGICNRK